MQANRYDRAAEAPILNTYVPINFGELYRIGAAQKQAVDEAAQQFNTQLQKFGEFRSPSAIDTQNYYNLTINRQDVQDAINQIVSNPDALKDAGFRANLQSIISNTDYGSLSLLKESADNLRAGLEMRAKMEAEGRYKKSWDSANIPNYDTLGSKRVFDQITPLRYMTADELANPYFSNLKPSSIGSVWKDGVKYNRVGITYDTLYDIADAKFNDLISTPQGQQYYREALDASGGDAELARQRFVGMIADSQRDRIVNQDTVDPYWLAMAKQSNRGSNEEVIRPNPTRLDFLNDSITRNTMSGIGNKFNSYRDYISSLITKYPNSKIADDARKGLRNIDRMQNEYGSMVQAANEYSTRYRQTGNDEDYVTAVAASNRAQQLQNQMVSLASKHVVRDEFQRVAGFSPLTSQDSKEFNTKSYLKGVNSALNKVSAPVGLLDKDDLLTGVGALSTEIQDSDGIKHQGYQFNTTEGFLLPETVFSMIADNEGPGRRARRDAGIGRDTSFPFRELVESGQLSGVQFIPNNKVVKTGPGSMALSGKLRIPKERIEESLGTGMWVNYPVLFNEMASSYSMPFGRQTTKGALKQQFGASKVTEVVGQDGVEYYEVDAYRTLPNSYTSSEYWQRVNQRWQGGSSSGIGGSSQAKDEYQTSAQQLLGR